MNQKEKIVYSVFQAALLVLGVILYHVAMETSIANGHALGADLAGLSACFAVALFFGIGGLIADTAHLALAGFITLVPAGGCILYKLAALALTSWWAISLPSLLAMAPMAVLLILTLGVCWVVLSGAEDFGETFVFGSVWVLITNAIVIWNFVAY